jgi:hypothetical protein
MSCSAEGPHRQRSQDVRLMRIIDIQAVLPPHADLEDDLLQQGCWVHFRRLTDEFEGESWNGDLLTLG